MYISMKTIKIFIKALALIAILIAISVGHNDKISPDFRRFLNGLGIALLILYVILSSHFGLIPDD